MARVGHGQQLSRLGRKEGAMGHMASAAAEWSVEDFALLERERDGRTRTEGPYGEYDRNGSAAAAAAVGPSPSALRRSYRLRCRVGVSRGFSWKRFHYTFYTEQEKERDAHDPHAAFVTLRKGTKW